MGDETVTIVERAPGVGEYLELIAAVGWRRREVAAVEVALGNSLYAVCAEVGGRVIGCGRVIGDGGMHLYLTDVVVRPEWQRRGVGTRMVERLTRWVEGVPYGNVIVAVLPTAGMAGFYARHGFKALGVECPVMQRWVNGKG